MSDIVTMGDWTHMRMWGMAIGVAMIGFAALAATGQIDPTKTLYASKWLIWLSALVGCAMFGFGMVLSSGCGSKTLVRVGGGSLKSLLVFVVMGVAAFASLKGITAVVRVATVDRVAVDFSTQAVWPGVAGVVGLSPATVGLALALMIGPGLLSRAMSGSDFVSFNNLLGGLGTGAVIIAMWWNSGHPGYLAEHPETLREAFLATNFGRAEALSFVASLTYTLDWLMFFSSKSEVLTLGFVPVFGVVAGSALVALVSCSSARGRISGCQRHRQPPDRCDADGRWRRGRDGLHGGSGFVRNFYAECYEVYSYHRNHCWGRRRFKQPDMASLACVLSVFVRPSHDR